MWLLIFVLSVFQGFQSLSISKVSNDQLTKDLMSSLRSIKRDTNFNCNLCLTFIPQLQGMLRGNGSVGSVLPMIESLCVESQFDKPYVCKGIVEQFGPELALVLLKIQYDAPVICGGLISNCGTPNVLKTQLWPMKLPGNKPPVKPWPTVKKYMPTMRVLHLSDIHIDWSYKPGSEANCTIGSGVFNTLCCRSYPDDAQNKTIQMPAGQWGTLAHCDLPYNTFISALSHIKKTHQLDYIIVTGDLVAHDIWDYSKEKTLSSLQNITRTLKSFFPTVPIYHSVGNHEGVPMDSLAPHSTPEYEIFGPQWLYERLSNLWMENPSVALDIKYRASYAVYVKKGLRLISLNSVYCSEWNFLVYLNPVDPDGTLGWLVRHLLDAEKKGEKVHLISHIPPGIDYCLKGWSFNFYEIVNRFENTIAAMFYGHTHNDEFNVFYENGNPKGRPTHFNWIAPSLTTYSYLNPAYRIYTVEGCYDGSSYTVIDAETYSTDVQKANRKNQEPQWILEYRTKEAYRMIDLSPRSWNHLIKRMKRNGKLLTQYIKRYYRDDQKDLTNDRASLLCSTKMGRSYDKENLCQ